MDERLRDAVALRYVIVLSQIRSPLTWNGRPSRL
jgi:hypothetical protein